MLYDIVGDSTSSHKAALKLESRSMSSQLAGQAAELAQAQTDFTMLRHGQRRTPPSSPSSPAARARMQEGGNLSDVSTVKLASLESRIRRLEEQGQPVPPGLAERLSTLEDRCLQSTDEIFQSASSHTVESKTQQISDRCDNIEENLKMLQTHVHGSETIQEPITKQPPHADGSPSAGSFEARLSRLEDQLLSLDSLEPSGMGQDSANLSSLTAAAPSQASLMLTLNFALGFPQQYDEADPSNATGHLTAVLRSAMPSIIFDILRVDFSRAAGGSMGASDAAATTKANTAEILAVQGAVCWLSASDVPAAKAEFRRQLDDAQSDLRRMLPGLVSENSSAVAWDPPIAVTTATTGVLASRVDDLERSRELLADNLGSVERRILHVERLYGGALGVQMTPQTYPTSGFAALGDLSLLSDMQDEGGNIGIRLGSRHTGPCGKQLSPTGWLKTLKTPPDDDSESSSRDFDFGQASASFDEPSSLAAASSVAEHERRRQQAEAAERSAHQAESRRCQSEEERERHGKAAAEAEAQARRDREQELSRQRQEERKRLEDASERIKEEERKAREKEEEARRQDIEEKKRKLQEQEEQRMRDEQQELLQQEAKRAEEEQRQLAAEALSEEERKQAELLSQEAEREAKSVRAESFWRRVVEHLLEKDVVAETATLKTEMHDFVMCKKAALESWCRVIETLYDQLSSREAEARRAEAVQHAQEMLQQQADAATPPLPPCEPVAAKSRRSRIQGRSLLARASKRSKDEEIRKAFDDIDTSRYGSLSLNDLQSYLCDYLGFGQSEATSFHKTYSAGNPDGRVPFEEFKKGYSSLNPYMLLQRRGEVIIRKPGSLAGEMLTLDGVEDCEIYACDRTAQVFADFCKRSLILIGPCESSVFVRDCEDCVFWMAVQQLRTNNCRRCTFFLYSKTEPIIETSDELAFAPWSAGYPGSSEQFKQAGFDPERNLWNAVFDFSGKMGHCNWRIMSVDEVSELDVELDDPYPVGSSVNPLPVVTHEMLLQAPLSSGESCGEGIANIPQSRPSLPPPPPPSFATISKHPIKDLPFISRPLGMQTVLSQAGTGIESVVEQQSHVTSEKLSSAAAEVSSGEIEPAVENSRTPTPPTPPPTVTVQGCMSGGEDDDDSSDGGRSPPQPMAAAAKADEAEFQDVPSVFVSSSVVSPSATATSKQVRQMLGEDSSEEEEEEETACNSETKPTISPSASASAKAKASSKAQMGAKLRHSISAPSVESSDDEEIEKAVAHMSAVNMPTGSISAATISAEAAKTAGEDSLLASIAPKEALEIPNSPGSNASWDDSSMGTPSPNAKAALGLDSPTSSAVDSPSSKRSTPARLPATKARAGASSDIDMPLSSSAQSACSISASSPLKPPSPAGVAASSQVPISPSGSSAAANQKPQLRSSGGMAGDDEDDYDDDQFDDDDDVSLP